MLRNLYECLYDVYLLVISIFDITVGNFTAGPSDRLTASVQPMYERTSDVLTVVIHIGVARYSAVVTRRIDDML
jgi:hypothetical protein